VRYFEVPARQVSRKIAPLCGLPIASTEIFLLTGLDFLGRIALFNWSAQGKTPTLTTTGIKP
jgi:hypothetical protein